MKCRYCGSSESKVVDSRPNEDGTAIRRRRECIRCGRRFTTFERVEEHPIMVVKRDGRREPFEREKISRVIMKACGKRPIPADVQDRLVEYIVREATNSMESEISSVQIGEIVMRQLRDVDEVAYVRFASVFLDFQDTNSFLNEVQRIRKEKE
ncbi:MAG TPA: transcriptional regulator NrdR [Eubacteriales bacterium]|nr:transcriptional regulator NrdR [Clostridia bacterium]HRV73606.1 transcriptional regulator NrdR [Eubacteriales bacterium]